MSGEKVRRITINQTEYDRLIRRSQEATSLAERNQILQRLFNQNEAELNRYNTRINQMNSTISNLNTQLNRVKRDADNRVSQVRSELAEAVRNADAAVVREAENRRQEIAALNTQMNNALRSVERGLHGEIVANSRRLEQIISSNDTAVRNLVKETEANLSRQITSVQSSVSSLQSRMDQIDAGNNFLLAQAREYETVAREVLRDTEENYRTNLLPGDRKLPVQEALETALTNINDAVKIPENSATARQTAAEAFRKAIRYRQAVLQAEVEWNQHYQAAIQAINAAQAQLEATRELELPPDAGQDAAIPNINVDWWSVGALSHTERQLDNMRASLESADNADLEDLDAYAANATVRSREIEDAAAFALGAAEASQLRFEMSAELAVSLRGKFGMEPVRDSDGSFGGYEQDDRRAAYRIHMKNPHTEFELVVDYVPQADAEGQLSIDVQSHILQHSNNQPIQNDENEIRHILDLLTPAGYHGDPCSTQNNSSLAVSHLRPDPNWAQRPNHRTVQRPATVAVKPTRPAGARA